MKTIPSCIFLRKCIVIALSFFSFISAVAQTETLSTGSYIINMGATNPNTIGNGLKPYGLIYDLMRNYNVPVKWVISQSKLKDGADFNYNGTDYKGGTFIIPAEFRTAAVNSRITFWQGQGVVGTTTTSALTVDVTRTLIAVPKWTLDAANGSIAQGYLTNAGITLTAFPGAYNFKAVTALDCCDDFFVMPHADPTWATHGRLYSWNRDCLGSIWAACHAVSALENSINPSNSAEQMNFLSTRNLLTTPTPWPNNSLKLWGTHGGGSIPYSYQYPNDQVAQFMGTTDLAQLNGSEQIYIPKQSTDPGGATRWRPGAKIIGYDPTQADVPIPDLANGNVAATIVYGRAFDDVNRGFVMYEAGHTHNKGTVADVAAQRAFLNFSFFQVQPKAPQLSFTGISSGQTINSNTTITGLNVSATSPLSGITFTYQWSSSCGGTFSNPTGTTTNFTAPIVGSTTNCVISCIVTDNCGRASFQSFPVVILGASPPTANTDAQTIDPGCGAATVTYNVLSNDTEPDSQPMTLTLINGNAGSFTTTNGGLVSFTASGNVTYTSALGYVGTDVLTYTVCDNTSPTPLCSNGTYTLTIGNIANVPNAVNDAVTIAEDAILTNYNVLANDLPLVSGPITVSGITVPPANGKVSINTDNTITYIPNADFAGIDVITYRIVNSLGYSKTATLTVTVTNDACDGGTYQSGSGVPTIISGNDWSKIYTRPVNTGGANLTNTIAYPINTGTNRLLVVAISAGGPNGIAAVPTVTWGGQPLTSLSVNRTDGNRSHSFIFYLKESAIAAASGNNLIVNMGAPTYYGYVIYASVYKDVDQTTSVRNGVSPNISGTASASPITASATANFVAGDQGIFVTGYSANGGTAVATYSSVSTNWTGSSSLFGGATSSSGSVGPYYGGVGVRNITTAATGETVSMTVTATGSLRPSITVVSLIPGSSCAAIPARAPLALPDTATTNSSTAIIIPVTTNDALFGQVVTSVTISTAPSNGSATVIGNTIQYTPSGSFNGVATLQYTVTTANGSDVVKVYINVTGTPVNAIDDAPAGALSGTVQTINVKANDIDPEGIATLSVGIVTAPKNGTASVDGSGNVVYTPNTGFTGNDTLYYSVCEPASICGTGFCDTARVVIVVQNRAPVANNDSKTILPCFANTINLLGNDTDVENGALTVTNISAVSPVGAGTLVNNNDGTVTFTPTSGLAPLPQNITFTYTVTDNGVTPQVSAPATVTITVSNPVNTAPIALNDAEETNMDQMLFASVRDNDSDPENQTLTIPTITIAPLHGSAIVNAVTGQIEYTPNPGFSGTDVLTYLIRDISIINPNTCTSAPDLSATATLTITVVSPNIVVGINDQNSTWINTPVSGSTLLNDFDPQLDLPLVSGGFIIGGIPYTSGTHIVSGIDFSGTPVANAGTLTINADGTYTYTPATDFIGVVNVQYQVDDSNPNTATDFAYLRITVNPLVAVGNSVIANNDEAAVLPNTTINSSLFVNDADPQGNTFAVTSYIFDTNGDGTKDGTGTVNSSVTIGGVTTAGTPVANAGSLTINNNGSYTFTPQSDFSGLIEIEYTITDALGATSTALLKIDVMPDVNGVSNNEPFGGDDFKYTNVNTTVSGSAITNSDGDPNGNTITVSQIGSTPVAGSTTVATPNGSLTIQPDGSYTYTPNPGYVGPDQITYTVCDNGVPSLCANSTLYFLTGIDNSTKAINDENSTWQDVNVSGSVLANDYDLENHTQAFGTFLAQGVSPGAPIASGATVSGLDKSGAAVATAGVLNFDVNGNYTFDPEPSFTGTISVPYRITDNGNQNKSDTAYLTITVDPLPTTGINTVIANNDENVSYGTAVNSSLFFNDVDPQQDAFTVTSFTGGTVGVSGTISGTDLNGNTVANAGTLIINSNGTYTYTPAAGFVGSINVPYVITDENTAVSRAVLHIDVLANSNGPANDPPVAIDDYGYTTINQPVTGNFSNNDSDPNGDAVSYNGVTIVPAGPATPIGAPVATVQGGTIQFYTNGTYLYTPPNGYIGPDRVAYTINDVTAVAPQPLSADAMIHLLIGPGINISGKVWVDANGNIIDAGVSEPETNISGALYVNLVNASNIVLATTPVAADGTYSFLNINPGATYTLQLSTLPGTVALPAPATQVPTNWVNTGETRNGTIDGGTLGLFDSRAYGFTNVLNYDFGIEQLPESNNRTQIVTPVAGNIPAGSVNTPVLGSDPEDGVLGNSNTIVITSLPLNATMIYNGAPVTLNQNISLFDPSLLSFNGITLGSSTVVFQYAFLDAASQQDPSPATFELRWGTPLPVTGLEVRAILKGSNNVSVDWKTETEVNSSHFIVERSIDNITFTAIGKVGAAGSSSATKYYYYNDDISALQSYKLLYYRIRQVDMDGKAALSNIATVRKNLNIQISAYPNPFVSDVMVTIYSQLSGTIDMRITDVTGRSVLQQKSVLYRGSNQVPVNKLANLPGGTYLLEVINNADNRATTLKLIKQ